MTDEFELTDEWLADLLIEEEEQADPYIYILGLDPGGTTGVAMLRIDSRDDKINPELIYLHQITDGRYGFKEFFEGSEVRDNVIVVSEKWKERNVKGADREPQYIEGGMHMLWGDDNIEYQYPDMKPLVPDEWLKENNLWTENRRHQMDALKHAFAYLRNQEHSATLESLAGEPGEGEPMAEPGAAEQAQLADPSGTPQDGESAGEGEGEGEGESQSFEELLAQIIEDLQDGADSGEDDRGAGSGQGAGGYGGYEESKAKRSERELNGAFAGFNPTEEDVTVLFED